MPHDHAAEYLDLITESTSRYAARYAAMLADDELDRPCSPDAAPEHPAPMSPVSEATNVWKEDEEPSSDKIDSPETPTQLIDGIPGWASESSATPSTPPISSAHRASPLNATDLLPAPTGQPTSPSTPVPLVAGADPSAVTSSRAAILRMLGEQHSTGPTVLAVQCARGHVSPPYAPACRVCGAQLPEQTPVAIPRPPLGRLVLSTGTTVVLDKGVLLGRWPDEPEVDNPAARPNVVRLVESGEISRHHASVSLDGWQVLLRDLGSSNGTYLTMPGAEPQQIRPQEDYELVPGSVVSLAEAVTFTFEVDR
jgi:hypothetical protein